MDEHHMDKMQVAQLMNVSYWAVHSWLNGTRQMPDNQLELLKFKLAAKREE